MKIPRAVKRLGLIVMACTAAVTFLIIPVPASTTDDDVAALYKTKCFACHGATAEKKFDATKPDAELADIILKGKKAEKPPNMPGFAEKGITPEQATALVTFMKAQKH